MLLRSRTLFFATVFTLIPFVASSAEPAGDSVSESVISRVVFGSCIQQDRPTPIFPVMLSAKPELLLFLGDNIYADTADIDVMRAKYDLLAKNNGFQALMSACPVMATWDDHDYGLNDGGASYPERDAAQQAFLDFWGVPADSPRRRQAGVYEAKMFGPPGKRVQVIMLDTRYFRSPLRKGTRQVGGPYLPDDDPEKTMLGEAQWKWLEQQLRLPADVRVIASGIQVVAEAAGQETWSNLPHERKRLFQLIQSTSAGGAIIVSGDRHWAEVSVVSDDVAYPLIDATSSSFNQKHPRGTPTRNQFRVIEQTYHKENFGVISIDWNGVDPEVTIDIRDMTGTSQIKKAIRLSELQPTK
ncbi:phosphodiesterase/alkaline phosphatase D [Rhodopirellula maiorica SM1]|uniref:Phosphodiesterase/alkaline phosphatase D n=1 Tax=Rhodopirellula maiorica SM1 TaxID=1265738 RepID=M5RRL0_9BACT|nr:alkaline phosphatase D family protein [Rhodopirellula maiorica]EMI21831.1 phosphodiesterase/alkaline phosphatase D [Rhodopirellula maiorica SM1]